MVVIQKIKCGLEVACDWSAISKKFLSITFVEITLEKSCKKLFCSLKFKVLKLDMGRPSTCCRYYGTSKITTYLAHIDQTYCFIVTFLNSELKLARHS